MKYNLKECAILRLLLDNGEVYEKHLFSNREIFRWQQAMMFLGIPIINIEKGVVYEDV